MARSECSHHNVQRCVVPGVAFFGREIGLALELLSTLPLATQALKS